MVGTLLAALVVCVVAPLLGQATLRLCGARRWSWLSAPIGLSLLMLIAVPGLHVPGRMATVAALVTLLTVGAAVWCLRPPAQRPALGDLAALLPAALLAVVPFVVNGRGGILGTSFNNDMASHMLLAESYMTDAVERVNPLLSDYPLGPHALVAALARGLGIRVDQAFTGFSIALLVLGAATALLLLRRASWPARVLTATVVGLPFLVAAYYGQGAFKEVLQAQLVLAVALVLAGRGPHLGARWRWVPVALLLGGILSVYSLTGLPWPLALLGLWLAGHGIALLRGAGAGAAWSALRSELPGMLVGAGLLLVVLIPQLPRLRRFVELRRGVNGTGIRKEDLGNLAGPLPGWESFGVWTTPDFRFPASFTGGMLTAFVLALVVLGAVSLLRRGRWMLPVAALSAMAIWWVSDGSQSPYVSAKALVIASPLLLTLAVVAIVERGARAPSWWRYTPLMGVALLAAVVVSDVRALRTAQVGPLDHAEQLRSFRAEAAGRPTLFLGYDDFARWALAGVPVGLPIINMAGQLPLRPEKAWRYPNAVDFDTVDAATINSYDWVIATRDAAGSAAPTQLRLVRATDDYALWRREGVVEPRQTLAEGEQSGAVLDCRTPEGRALARTRGEAAVREAPVTVPGVHVPAGGRASVSLPLGQGRWNLAAVYQSALPLDVRGSQLDKRLPANLEWLGARWPLGELTVGSEPATLTVTAPKPLFAPAAPGGTIIAFVASKGGSERVIALRAACGRYVDWYRTR
jgi:hypothetical protein